MNGFEKTIGFFSIEGKSYRYVDYAHFYESGMSVDEYMKKFPDMISEVDEHGYSEEEAKHDPAVSKR